MSKTWILLIGLKNIGQMSLIMMKTLIKKAVLLVMTI